MARSSSSPTSRRRFLKIAGAAGLSAAFAAPVVALAQSAGAPRGRRVPKPVATPLTTTPAPADSSAAEPPSEFGPDAKAIVAIIERRYGKHLDAKQLDEIAKDVDGRMQGGKALRAVKLANGDEPEFRFHA